MGGPRTGSLTRPKGIEHCRGGRLVVVDIDGPEAAEALLAPLVAADRAGAGELVDSLRTWLARHGQWEPAAARLGVHRHTLRKRIRRAGELLRRDLDSPGVRAELWLALHVPVTDPAVGTPERGVSTRGATDEQQSGVSRR